MGDKSINEPTFLLNNELVAHLLPGDLDDFNSLVGGINPNKPHKDKFLMEHSKRTLYKILSRQLKGFNEARFYHLVFCIGSDPYLKTLRDFLPAYRGLFYRPTTGQYFIAMDNVQYGLQNPNSMDVKLGQQSYVPSASPNKRKTEEAKYRWRRQLGFFITGMKLDGIFYDRNHGSSLCPDTIYEKGICLFLDGKEDDEKVKLQRRSLLGRLFAERVGSLKAWFETQETHRFVASSLFICYDWQGCDIKPIISFHLIDFARWYTVTNTGNEMPSHDENCLFGLEKLHSLFQQAGGENAQ
nr:inositol polyphosphate multikinase [Hymenolepis microstoma]